MVSCVLLVLSPLWIHALLQSCWAEELSREAVLSWFRERVLDGLGLEEPPVTRLQRPDGDAAQPPTRHMHERALRTSRTAWVHRGTGPAQETSQIILFPSFGEKLVVLLVCEMKYFGANIVVHSMGELHRIKTTILQHLHSLCCVFVLS